MGTMSARYVFRFYRILSFPPRKEGLLQGKMVAVCILRARILRARLVRGGLKPIQKRIHSFVTSTSFRECPLSSSRVRSRDGFQPLVSSEKEGDFCFFFRPRVSNPLSFFLFSLSPFFSFSTKGEKGQQQQQQQQQQQLIIIIKSSLIKK